jgi:PAS domain S-box-containing protein
VAYYWPTTFLSLVLAIFASAFALYIVSRPRLGMARASVGSLIMGAGIAGMHYVGMAAMRLPATMHFGPLLVVLSVMFAIVFSFAALMLTFDLRKETRELPSRKFTSAVVMAAAVSLMHYIGMASVTFIPSAVLPNMANVVNISLLGNNAIAAVTVIVLGATMLNSSVDRRAQIALRRVNEGLERRVIERTSQLSAAIEGLKLTQEALRGSEAYLAEAQKLSHTASWAFDTVRQVPIYWSEEWYRMSGLDPLQGPSTEEARALFAPEEWSRLTEMITRAMQEKSDCETDTYLRIADGSIKHIHVVTHPVVNASGVVELVGTVMDITARKKAEEKIRKLSERILELQDEERRKIAGELHDAVGQDLVALTTLLSQIRESIPPTARKVQTLVSDSEALANHCLREIRTLSYVLFPPVLSYAGLPDAIRDYVKGFTKRSGINVVLEISSQLERMAQSVELALFRVVQESLTNIYRHSGSPQAIIRITCDSKLTLEISDSGHGTTRSHEELVREAPFEPGLGIPSMRERVEFIGGRLEIYATSVGTTVRVTIPLGERT